MSETNFSGPVVSTNGFTGDLTGGITLPIVTPTGATTLTAAQSGSIISLTAAAGYAVTLPAVASSAGLTYRFVIGVVHATTDWVITSAAADIYGVVDELSTVQAVAGATTVNLELATATIGDWYDLYSDGTNWYINGHAAQAASVTPA